MWKQKEEVSDLRGHVGVGRMNNEPLWKFVFSNKITKTPKKHQINLSGMYSKLPVMSTRLPVIVVAETGIWIVLIVIRIGSSLIHFEGLVMQILLRVVQISMLEIQISALEIEISTKELKITKLEIEISTLEIWITPFPIWITMKEIYVVYSSI